MWKRLWAVAAEFLSTHPSDPLAPVGAPSRRTTPDVVREQGPPAGAAPADGSFAEDGAALAHDADDEDFPALPRFEKVAFTDVDSPATKASAPDPYEVLARLARLVAERAAADERLGRACLLVRRFGVARQLGWSCFEEWCVERLGLAPSTVYQRIALERRLAALPELRDALRSRRLSYEQARLVARVATRADVAARIEDAAGKSCIALLRDLEAEERLQMCDAGELRAVVPEDVDSLLAEAIRAARLHWRRLLTAGEALVEVARHFVWTWAPEVMRLVKGADPVILRDEGLCRVPGCSRPADHVHHLRFRSAGGPLEEWNELSLCAVHHLLGVHRGNVLVAGRAPDRLTFVLGEREVAALRT